MQRRDGFTLIELLIVVVIIGILASLGVLKYRQMEVRAYTTTVYNDLRVLSQHQELYNAEHERYGATETLVEFTPSRSVDVTIVNATFTGWSATATHAGIPGFLCAIYIGDAPALAPASHPGVIECTGP